MTLATPAPKLKYKEFITRNKSNLTLIMNYRNSLKGLYVVARIFFLLLLNCSARPCLGPA